MGFAERLCFVQYIGHLDYKEDMNRGYNVDENRTLNRLGSLQ